MPAGLFLGGAPFNVACHLRAAGVPSAMVSRVGADRLGEEILRRAARFGVATDLMQVDAELPTGFVRVSLDASGVADYDIVAPAAWDAIAPDELLLERAAAARAIVFGSLAQRHATSRATIERLWESDAIMVFDVNLRPPFDDREVVAQSLKHANIVKVSHTELQQLVEWFDLPTEMRDAAAALAETFNCDTVCVTRAALGAGLWHANTWAEHPGFEVEVRDTVGAGDAFLAVLLAGLLGGSPASSVLEHANLIGAYVATQYGAVPTDQGAAVAQGSRPAVPQTKARRR
ncbi:MAG: PfkB family carbohydrate kinase [bacterium]